MCHILLEETYTLPGTSWEITTVIGLEAVRAYGVGLKRPRMHKLGQVTKLSIMYLREGHFFVSEIGADSVGKNDEGNVVVQGSQHCPSAHKCPLPKSQGPTTSAQMP